MPVSGTLSRRLHGVSSCPAIVPISTYTKRPPRGPCTIGPLKSGVPLPSAFLTPTLNSNDRSRALRPLLLDHLEERAPAFLNAEVDTGWRCLEHDPERDFWFQEVLSSMLIPATHKRAESTEFTDSTRRHEVLEDDTKKRDTCWDPTSDAGTAPRVGWRKGQGPVRTPPQRERGALTGPWPFLHPRRPAAGVVPARSVFFVSSSETSCLRVEPPRSLRPPWFPSS